MINFSSETMRARGEWSEIFSVKRKNPPAYNLYFVHCEISFKNEGVAGTPRFHCRGPRFNPQSGGGTEILQAASCGQKKKERERNKDIFRQTKIKEISCH